jgi:hypothetical protein
MLQCHIARPDPTIPLSAFKVRIRADSLNEVVSLCETMNDRGRQASISNSRVFYARAYFQKCTFHGRSICLLVAPLKKRRESDLAGICALARSLIETHNAFVYLTEPGLSTAEHEFRVELMHLNQACDLQRISERLGIPEGISPVWSHGDSRDFATAILNRNAVFLSLDEKQRAHLLRGKTPYLMERYLGKRPIDRKIEAAAYNLFSHNVHSYGLSSSCAGSWTPAGYKNLLFMAVEISLIFMAHLAKRYKAVRGRALGAMSNREQELLDEVLSLNHFDEWKCALQTGVDW